jgi:hypothetical protein
VAGLLTGPAPTRSFVNASLLEPIAEQLNDRAPIGAPPSLKIGLVPRSFRVWLGPTADREKECEPIGAPCSFMIGRVPRSFTIGLVGTCT